MSAPRFRTRVLSSGWEELGQDVTSSPTSRLRLRSRLNSSSSSGLNPEPEPEPERELTSVTITVAEQKELNKFADNTAVHLDTAEGIPRGRSTASPEGTTEGFGNGWSVYGLRSHTRLHSGIGGSASSKAPW